MSATSSVTSSPPSLPTLRDHQQSQGAVINPAIAPVPHTYNNRPVLTEALDRGTVIVDRSHWTRLHFTGEDRLNFLHNQTTQDLKTRQPGQGCLTVIVTATARTIDLALTAITDDGVLLLGSPGMGDRLMQWFDRYIFPMDRVTVTDCTADTVTFSVLGSQSQSTLTSLGFASLENLNPYDHQTAVIDGMEVRAIAHSGLGRPGYTLWTDAAHATPLWEKLTALGAVPAGETDWEAWRIEDGVPKPGHELTDDYNPLEAGLWHGVSINKGCYIGQETLARLNTYDGVKQYLYGIQLSQPLEPGTKLATEGGDRAGILTSCLTTETGALGLAYIRRKIHRKIIEENGLVTASDPDGTTVTGAITDLPFPVRTNPDTHQA